MLAGLGCTPCAEVVHDGLLPSEPDGSSVFDYALCAEREGALSLARDGFERAMHLQTESEGAVPDLIEPYHSALARFHLARVLERLGRRGEALLAYASFVNLWEHADRPVPELEEARRALARLEGTK
jgi:hypothetical protein